MGQDGVNKLQIEDPRDTLHPIYSFMHTYNFVNNNYTNRFGYHRYWHNNIPKQNIYTYALSQYNCIEFPGIFLQYRLHVKRTWNFERLYLNQYPFNFYD